MGEKGAILLAARGDGTKCFFVCGLSQKVVDSGIQAGKLVGGIAKVCGGGGGGKPKLAQAGGRDSSKLPEALE